MRAEMNHTTRLVVSTFGALAGIAGIEHGIGELLQGSQAPNGLVIESWPDSEFFRILAGEPAMTILPNLAVAGVLTILVSLIFLVWAILFVQRKNGGLIMILWSILLLLVGGGFGPPLLGILLGSTATQINSPLIWWRTHLPAGARRFLARVWLWSYGACLLAWLALFPGLSLLAYFFGVDDETLVRFTISSAFGSLLLTIFTGFVRDVERQSSSA
jgi:hypothetical protein